MEITNEQKNKYFNLAKELEKIYPLSSFKNHCYWRIALDNTFKNKWDFDEERFMMRKLMWNHDATQSRSFE